MQLLCHEYSVCYDRALCLSSTMNNMPRNAEALQPSDELATLHFLIETFLRPYLDALHFSAPEAFLIRFLAHR